jgi:hypothetical protein
MYYVLHLHHVTQFNATSKPSFITLTNSSIHRGLKSREDMYSVVCTRVVQKHGSSTGTTYAFCIFYVNIKPARVLMIIHHRYTRYEPPQGYVSLQRASHLSHIAVVRYETQQLCASLVRTQHASSRSRGGSLDIRRACEIQRTVQLLIKRRGLQLLTS